MIKTVVVIDAQGGGVGKNIITNIKNNFPQLHVIAAGTNSIATSAMLKAGADEGGTGENAIKVCAQKADIIIGPIGMVIADSMLGEITPEIAVAVAQSDAIRIMIPFANCDNYIAGVKELSVRTLIENAMEQLKKLIGEEH